MGGTLLAKRLIAIATLTISLVTLLALTGPRPDLEVSGVVRRFGGACLQLDRWTMLGWTAIGQTHSVSDTRKGVWHPVSDDPPCADALPRRYLIRNPFDAPQGTYRICGLADEQACVTYQRIPFQGTSSSESISAAL